MKTLSLKDEPFDFSYEFDDYENGLLESDPELEPEFDEFEPEFASPSTHTVPAGAQYLDTSRSQRNPLRVHSGVGDNLALRWNAVPRAAQEIDVVVHLHGYIDRPPNGATLRALVARSGLDLSGRTRPTLALVPRGRRITPEEVRKEQERLNELARKLGRKPRPVRSDRFTFPALLSGDGAGIESALAYAVEWFTRNVLGRSDGQSLRVGRLIFTAHSGGGAALNALLARHVRRRVCNPDEVHAFDAFYGKAFKGGVDGVKSWVAARLAKDRAIVTGSRGLVGRDATDPLGGGLRVIYRAGTQPLSCEVDAVLPGSGDPLRSWYRAERTTVEHDDIPSKFGGALLRDRAADLGLRSECPARSKSSRAPRTTSSPASSAPQPTPRPSNGSLFQQIQNALASGQWYLALSLAVLSGDRDPNRLTNLIFFARHPHLKGRKLASTEPNFKQLSQEWLDIRDRIARPFLNKPTPAKPSSAKPTKPIVGSKPYPEVNTPLPPGGPGFIRRWKNERRSYGLPGTIQALQEIAADWHMAHPNGPRIVISDISPQGGSQGRFEPHSSHRVGLDVDLTLEGGKARWYNKKEPKINNRWQWEKNPTYSVPLTQELARLILGHPKGGLKVKFILFDDPEVMLISNKVRKDPKSPHRDHFHVRFCAPAYFAPKVDERYKACN
ncbi:MAG: penicillin-insensitive murein endopeptidase [Acidimicrobiia bacterium]